MLAALKSCPVYFRNTYIDHWKAKTTSVHLHAGGAFAKGLEEARRAFYERGAAADDAQAEGLRALLTAYGDFQCPEDSAKSARRMSEALVYYFDNYPLSHDDAYPITLANGRRGIEFSFAHPLPVKHPVTGDPLLYVGRSDAIIKYHGPVYICDEKTASALGPTWSRQWDLRGQFIGYQWGARESGIDVWGSLVRGVAILKTMFKTEQVPVRFEPWQIAQWLEETVQWVELAIEWWRNDRWLHNFDKTCADFGGCAFRRPCLSQDPKPWLAMDFERRVWNPLLRTEYSLESGTTSELPVADVTGST